MKKRLVAGIVILIILTFICPAVFAYDFAAADGKITLVLKDTDGKAATSGLRIGLYKVGEVLMKDESDIPVYILTDAFKPSGADLVIVSEEDMREQAALVAAYVSDGDIKPLSAEQATSDNGGVLEFTDLDSGIYLVTQLSSGVGEGGVRRAMTSFLIRVPDFNETTKLWSNEVTAWPKISKRPPGEPPVDPPGIPPTYTPPPTKEEGSAVIEEPAVPIRDWPADEAISIQDELTPLGFLPQTGLLRWPIPLMSISGALTTACGVMVVKRAKKEDDDEE
jgi:hypothetical protein